MLSCIFGAVKQYAPFADIHTHSRNSQKYTFEVENVRKKQKLFAWLEVNVPSKSFETNISKFIFLNVA